MQSLGRIPAAICRFDRAAYIEHPIRRNERSADFILETEWNLPRLIAL